MSFVVQSMGQRQYKVNAPTVGASLRCRMPTFLYIVIFLTAPLGLLVCLARARYNTCVEDKVPMVFLVLTSGISFITLILSLIPICWTAQVITQD